MVDIKEIPDSLLPRDETKHRTWVKTTHWIGTASFLLLLFSGYVILMVHPRLYWGEVGNDLTPALFELPISKNYHHEGWKNTTPFFNDEGSPVSASRTFDIFNQNGWGRSLHFLAAWFLVFSGLIYLFTGVFSGHFRYNILPAAREFPYRLFLKEIVDHLRLKISPVSYGPHYSLLQKCTYSVVIFFLFPVIILTGLTMSPAITAAYPFLLKLFFGAQSARTIHFFAAVLLTIFLLAHLLMIILTGFKRHMRAMTFGK